MDKSVIATIKKVKEAAGGEDPYFAIKLVLLKLMADRGHYFPVPESMEYIMDCFTLDRIVRCWAGQDVFLFEEREASIPQNSRPLLRWFVETREINLESETEMILGEIYQEAIPPLEKKEYGITYTPDEIREYMTGLVRKEIEAEDRLLDPCCGCGCFLLAFYHALLNRYYSFGVEEPIKQIHERILRDNIYGVDSSPLACAISKISLALLYPDWCECPHIHSADALLEAEEIFGGKSFDWVVTNPPYIGHKKMKAEYKKVLGERYPEVFFNKSDISYCFFSLGERLLRNGGSLLYITSRYFAQSLYAQRLRSFLLENFTFVSVVDYYGMRPFKTAEIDPLIIFLKKGRYSGNVFKAVKATSRDFDLLDRAKEGFLSAEVYQDELTDEGFSFATKEEKGLVEAIEARCGLSLSDAMESFQGAITGFDRAFVVSGKSPEVLDAVRECGVKWIKGKDLADPIRFGGKWLLYVDDATDPAGIPATMRRLAFYRSKLSARREVKKGSRSWQSLQWARKRQLFEEPKILFPYKAPAARFFYDAEGYFFSADIYAMRPKEGYEELDMRKLAMLLSSPVYDSYFKSFLKKLGNSLYEFYPNAVMRARIPDIASINALSSPEEVEGLFGLPAEGGLSSSSAGQGNAGSGA
jgi:adenine-specific DNA-methyltransferase